MSTRCEIAVPRPEGYDMIYVHYDGYPSWMLPALRHHTTEMGLENLYQMLRESSEFRIFTRDLVEPYDPPRAPRFSDILEVVHDYAYIYNTEIEDWEVLA